MTEGVWDVFEEREDARRSGGSLRLYRPLSTTQGFVRVFAAIHYYSM